LIIVLDSSILVEVDRKNKTAVHLCKHITQQHDAYISIITVAEILTGSYQRSDMAVKKANQVLRQFRWIPMGDTIADITAQLTAYLLTTGKIIEFQDIVIAASALAVQAELLLTQNPTHFNRIPKLVDIVQTLDQVNLEFD